MGRRLNERDERKGKTEQGFPASRRPSFLLTFLLFPIPFRKARETPPLLPINYSLQTLTTLIWIRTRPNIDYFLPSRFIERILSTKKIPNKLDFFCRSLSYRTLTKGYIYIYIYPFFILLSERQKHGRRIGSRREPIDRSSFA